MPKRPKQAFDKKKPNNKTSNNKKSWWKTLLTWTVLVLLIPFLQFAFGDGAFWQWQQGNFEKEKYRTELYEKLTQNFAQAVQVHREQLEACFREEGNYYVARSDAEKAKTGCHQKETNLSLINETIKRQEEQLAELEGREPRNFTIEALDIPKAPSNLR